MTSGAEPSGEGRAEYVKQYDEAQAAGDYEAMAAAALRLAGLQMFGTLPGRLPAFLHEAYRHAEGRQRIELAIAIARAWGYANQHGRAREFAAEAVASEAAAADPALLAAALDASLISAWGPDDLEERLRITASLEDTAAHVADVEVQMSAYLWRLTTALECLDVPAMRRQLRGLEQLAADSGAPRVRFFAEARRGMHAVLVGDLDAADRARHEAVEAGNEAAETDTYAIDRSLSAAIARQAGDVERLNAEAEIFEEFGLREGVSSIAAEAAQLWLGAGEPDRARRLLHQIGGADLGQIARDVDWLLTTTALTEVAAAVGDLTLCTRAIELLTPYAGRGVSNAGAVTFAGVVDHYLALASAAIGDPAGAERWGASAVNAYDRMGAVWWANRCRLPGPAGGGSRFVLRPTGGGTWQVGHGSSMASIKAMRGLHYLQLLLAHPGRDITARELSAAGAGRGDDPIYPEPALQAADAQAIAAYRKRLTDIEAELDEADSAADPRRSEALAAERDAMLAELRRVTGLGGRTRNVGGTDERARVAVRKAIAAAIARITEVDAVVARALSAAVTTGSLCRYQPDPDRPITWTLS